MADFGLYSALSQPRRNWAQVRQDRMMELGMLQSMQQDLQQRIQAESQARAGVVEYMNQLQQSSVLEGDYERVKAVEQAERQKIVEGIQKAGNNVQKFLNGDGIAILNTYRNNIMQSDEMRNAIGNKLAFAQAGLDKYMGRIARPVYDEQGNRITFEQQMEQFQNGERERLEYGGSVEPVDMTKIRTIVQNTYGKNRYKRQAAGADDIYNIARELGAEDWMAEDIRDGYMAGVEAGAEPLTWKWDEAPKAQGGLDFDRLTKLMGNNLDLWQAYLKGNRGISVKNEKFGDRTMKVITSPINEILLGKLKNSAYIKQDEDGLYTEGIAYTSDGKPVSLLGAKFNDKDIIDYKTIIDPETNSEQYYLRAKVDLSNRSERDIAEGWWAKNMPGNIGGTEGRGLVRAKGTEVYIPVDGSAAMGAMNRFEETKEKRFGENVLEDYLYKLGVENSLMEE